MEPGELFRRFRGRDPAIEFMLEKKGLAAATSARGWLQLQRTAAGRAGGQEKRDGQLVAVRLKSKRPATPRHPPARHPPTPAAPELVVAANSRFEYHV